NSVYAAYQSHGAGYAAAGGSKAAAATTTPGSDAAATAITLSEAAMAALAERDFTTVLADARTKLAGLLADADRLTPLQDGQLALDLSSLDQRELYAMASDAGFSADEQEAAGLEMQRRLEAALAGPAAVAR